MDYLRHIEDVRKKYNEKYQFLLDAIKDLEEEAKRRIPNEFIDKTFLENLSKSKKEWVAAAKEYENAISYLKVYQDLELDI